MEDSRGVCVLAGAGGQAVEGEARDVELSVVAQIDIVEDQVGPLALPPSLRLHGVVQARAEEVRRVRREEARAVEHVRPAGGGGG